MLGAVGYKYKKDLQAAIGHKLQFIETSLFGREYESTGRNTVVGPDAYHDRRWYATVTTEQDIIKKVE